MNASASCQYLVGGGTECTTGIGNENRRTSALYTKRYRRQERNNLGDPNVQWWKTKEDGASGEPEPTGGERSHSAYTTVMSRAQTRKVEVALSRWNQKDEMSMLMCSVR